MGPGMLKLFLSCLLNWANLTVNLRSSLSSHFLTYIASSISDFLVAILASMTVAASWSKPLIRSLIWFYLRYSLQIVDTRTREMLSDFLYLKML